MIIMRNATAPTQFPSHLALRRYDNVHFLPNKICSTAKVRKVARSKFCTTTWCNVARFDHFCPWINNAIGEENYRIFLLFLCCHALFLCYGAVCISFILYDLILWNTDALVHFILRRFICEIINRTFNAHSF